MSHLASCSAFSETLGVLVEQWWGECHLAESEGAGVEVEEELFCKVNCKPTPPWVPLLPTAPWVLEHESRWADFFLPVVNNNVQLQNFRTQKRGSYGNIPPFRSDFKFLGSHLQTHITQCPHYASLQEYKIPSGYSGYMLVCFHSPGQSTSGVLMTQFRICAYPPHK